MKTCIGFKHVEIIILLVIFFACIGCTHLRAGHRPKTQAGRAAASTSDSVSQERNVEQAHQNSTNTIATDLSTPRTDNIVLDAHKKAEENAAQRNIDKELKTEVAAPDLAKAKAATPDHDRQAETTTVSAKSTRNADESNITASADAYYQKPSSNRRVEDCRRAVIANPDDAKAHYNLGLACIEAKEYQQAIQALEHAIKTGDLSSDLPEAYYNVGIAHEGKGNLDKAIGMYKHALELDLSFAKAHYNLGAAYVKTTEISRALDEYKILKTLDSKAADELFDLIYP